MMEWPRYALRELAPAIPSRSTPDPGNAIWHLGLDQIESHTGTVLTKNRGPVSEAGNSTFSFDRTHVLYSKLRPYLNKVVVPEEPGIATTELIPLQPRPHLVSREFLAYYLRSPVFLSYASQYVTGAKMPRVILDRFWAHEIALPTPHGAAPHRRDPRPSRPPPPSPRRGRRQSRTHSPGALHQDVRRSRNESDGMGCEAIS